MDGNKEIGENSALGRFRRVSTQWAPCFPPTRKGKKEKKKNKITVEIFCKTCWAILDDFFK